MPAYNCTAEYIDETSRYLKEEFQTIEIKLPVPSKPPHLSLQITQKQNLKILQ